MSRNIVFELFLIALVALFWIPGALAYPQYLDAYNSTFSTNASCGICHVNPANGGPRTSYGMQFENQTNHATNPGAALTAIGPGPGTTSTAIATTTATSMVTAVSTATPNVTKTSIVTTPIPTETPLATETPIPVATTPAPTPGFGQGIFIVGLLACYFILKRHNKN
ncbi:MAG: hypothetical protein OIN66_01100 [Candidatus Methanoperedens sp.]|nr:hypothetical protein [Candidatus Methanoperedens sp.]